MEPPNSSFNPDFCSRFSWEHMEYLGWAGSSYSFIPGWSFLLWPDSLFVINSQADTINNTHEFPIFRSKTFKEKNAFVPNMFIFVTVSYTYSKTTANIAFTLYSELLVI